MPRTGKWTIKSYGPTPFQALSLTCFLPWFPEQYLIKTPFITFVCKSKFWHCPSGGWSKKACLKVNISGVVFLGSVNRKHIQIGRKFLEGTISAQQPYGGGSLIGKKELRRRCHCAEVRRNWGGWWWAAGGGSAQQQVSDNEHSIPLLKRGWRLSLRWSKKGEVTWFLHFRASDFLETFHRSSLALNIRAEWKTQKLEK